MPTPDDPRRGRGRRALFAIIAGLVVIAIGGFAFIYFVLFPTSSPKPFALKVSTAAMPVSAGTSLAGRWTVSWFAGRLPSA